MNRIIGTSTEPEYILNAINLDAAIQELQRALKNITWVERVYARARLHADKTNDKVFYIPKVYYQGSEYFNPLTNDQVNSQMWFQSMGAETPLDYGSQNSIQKHETTIALILWYNITKTALSDQDFLTTEIAKRDVFTVLNKFPNVTIQRSYDERVKDVFKEYTMEDIEQRLMHPWAGIRLEFKLTYNYSCLGYSAPVRICPPAIIVNSLDQQIITAPSGVFTEAPDVQITMDGGEPSDYPYTPGFPIDLMSGCPTLTELWNASTTEEKIVLYLALTDLERADLQEALPDIDLFDLYEALTPERRLYLFQQLSDSDRSYLFNGIDDDERLYLFVNMPVQDQKDLYLGLTDAQRIVLQSALAAAQLFALYDALNDSQRIGLFQTLSTQNQIDIYIGLTDAQRLSLQSGLTGAQLLALYDALTNAQRLTLLNGISTTKKEQLVFYTYHYPLLHTGEVTSFQTGDSKHQWDNIYAPEIAAWPLDRVWVFPVIDPTNFALLKRGATAGGNNIFGNLQRWTDDLGGQTYASGVQIDHFLGIMMDITFSGAHTNWAAAITASVARNFYSKTDWRNGNYIFWTLFTKRATGGNYLSGLPAITFLNVPADSGDKAIWTSSSLDLSPTTQAASYILRNTSATNPRNFVGGFSKTVNTAQALYVRKCFTYNSGTGLMAIS